VGSTQRLRCACLGCSTFHRSSDIAEGPYAHHTRLLLALDLSIAAARRSRGIAACDGIDDSAPCEVGMLHTRSAELAIALVAPIEEPSNSAHAGRATSAVDALLADGQWLAASTMAGARQTRLNIARAYDPAAPPGRARRVARRAIADEDAIGQPQPRAQAPRAGRVAR